MRTRTKLLIAAAILACAAGGGAVAANQYMSELREARAYLGETSINGVAVQGMTPDQAAQILLANPEEVSVSVLENGEAVLSGSLPEYGVNVDTADFQSALEDVFAQQTHNIIHALKANYGVDELTVDIPYSIDEKAFAAKVNGAGMSVERTPGTDAEIVFDEKKKLCYIKPEVDGNELDDAKLQQFVRGQIEDAIKADSFKGKDQAGSISKLEMEIPEDVYLETNKRKSGEDLQAECDRYNKYAHASITYTFGSETKELDFRTFKDWLKFDGDSDTAEFDDEKIDAYVAELSDVYDTRWRDRTFTTSSGNQITIDAGHNEYGYWILGDEEEEQIKEDLTGNEPVTREPIYSQANEWGNPYYLAREGVDDINGTYVEVNLSAQHVWFYKNGELIVESDCVSGDMSKKDRATMSGAYPIAYKEMNVTLSGGEGKEHYDTKVKYWMPFNAGQGLHDADWRGSFGGDIYTYDGSHGCVNLPPSVAATMYEYIDVGTPVILYY